MRKTKSITIISILIIALIPAAIPMFQTATAATTYTEINGTLNGANYTIRIPSPVENWNGKVALLCHGYSSINWITGQRITVPPAFTSPGLSYWTGIASGLIANGYALAASDFGATGYSIQKGMSSTLDLTQYVIKNYNVTGKIFLIGVSMGSNIALLLGQKYPNIYSGVLDLSGNKDLTMAYNSKIDFLSAQNDSELAAKLQAITAPVPPYPISAATPGPLSNQLQVWRTFCNFTTTDYIAECNGTPTTSPQAYANISPTQNPKISIPIITIHGTSDALVPYSQALKYQDAITAAGCANLYRLYTVQGGEHANTPILNLAIPKFLELTAWSDSLDSAFSIMQISDTQFLAASFPQLFKDTTSWIVNNSASYNLKMVVHTGDVVDNINGTSGTYSDPIQWNTANTSMSLLLNAGIPYCWDAGNHDQIPWNNASGTWLGSSYLAFNATSMHSKPYWVSDTADSKNTAVKFTYNGYGFLIVNVEYMANNATIAWMKTLLDNNKGSNVIVAAHTYLNKAGGYGFASAGLPGEVAWCNNFKTILDGYPNVFLTLSGHDPTGTANMTRVGSREEIYFDRQSATTTAGQTGAAAVRVYTFDMISKQVNTTTYSLDTQSWLTTATNQFSFSVDSLTPLPPPLAASAFCNVTVMTGQTWYFFAQSSGGLGADTYQWYEGPTVLAGQTSMLLPISKAAAGTYTYTCKVTDTLGTTATTNAITLTVINK